MKFCIILQARLGSKRFPNKILKDIYKNYNSLTFLIKRIKKSKINLIIATTKSKKDNKIISICKKNNVLFFRGSENNVFARFKKAANLYGVENIIRLTSDCPLIDFSLLKKMKNKFIKNKLDYISNTLPIKKSRFPNGSDIEIFKSSIMNDVKNLSREDKEHVTNKYWKLKKIKKETFSNKEDLSILRYTLDYREDLLVIKKILNHLSKNKLHITYRNISNYLIINKKINLINKKFNKVFQGKDLN